MRRIVFIFREIPDMSKIFIDDMTHKYGRDGRIRNIAVKNYLPWKKVIWKRQKRDC